jgi:hypothetical protein
MAPQRLKQVGEYSEAELEAMTGRIFVCTDGWVWLCDEGADIHAAALDHLWRQVRQVLRPPPRVTKH